MPALRGHTSVQATALREKDRNSSACEAAWRSGFDGLLELLGGAAPTIGLVLHTVQFLTQDEIAADPRDLAADTARRIVAHLSVATEHFVAVYPLIHGIGKVSLVYALRKRILLAYALSSAIFTALVAYQLYRYELTHSLGLLVLTVSDVVIVVLIYLECRSIRPHRM